MIPRVEAFFHEPTSTYSYVVRDPESQAAVIIDPVLDYDHRAGRTSTASADRLLAFVTASKLEVQWILETHAHADHLSAAKYLQVSLDAPIAIGEGIRRVQTTFKKVFNLDATFAVDGGQFDRLLADGETFAVGGLAIKVLSTPGHTNDSITYLIGDAAFIGDTLFMPDYGTARADFPGGDSATLYRSIQRIYALPAETRLFLCHDYPPDGRTPQPMTTVGAQQAGNVHVRDGVSEQAFVTMRDARDATLAMPNLIIPSIQVNIRAGALPDPDSNGVSYLRVPLNVLGRAPQAARDD